MYNQMYNQGFVPSYEFGSQGLGQMFGQQPQIGSMKKKPPVGGLKRPGLGNQQTNYPTGTYSPYPPIGLPPAFSHGIN